MNGIDAGPLHEIGRCELQNMTESKIYIEVSFRVNVSHQSEGADRSPSFAVYV